MTEYVKVTVEMPKAFIDDLLKRKWFKAFYNSLEEFTADAIRRLKQSHIEGIQARRDFDAYLDSKGLLQKWAKWKVENPKQSFADFLAEIATI